MRIDFLSASLYFIVFITGAAGLIYQVTWQKYLSRLLGSDTMATAIILAPFLGSLKNLLETGIAHTKNAYERNWCTFQLALFLIAEKADKKSIESVLSKTVRGNDGNVIIKEADTLLLQTVHTLLENYQ